ncbi:hypothetical protein KC867_01060 [Candidatus Saccharibacteria bacterium]|nr:hypothetical protein [Candidatus Saccharibacteria bacterium]
MKNKPNPAIISLIAIAVLGVITTSVVIAKQTTSEETTSNNSTESIDDTAVEQTEESSDSTYQDGDYSATGSYSTPGGQESITLSLTIEDDIITQVNAVGSASRGDSAQYQSAFLSGYKSSVVGKDIKTVKLSRVAGSSLTSTGFNRAIEKIKDEAING